MKALHAVVPFVLTLLSLVGCGEAATPPEGHAWLTVTSGTTRALLGVDLRTDGTALAVGEGGTILVSSDAGKTWKTETSPVTSDLTNVRWHLNGDAFATSRVGEVLRRTNNRWTVVAYAPGQLPLWRIDAAQDRVLAIGGTYASRETPVVLTSIDAGRSWSSWTALAQKLRMSPHGFYAYSASDVVMVGTCGQGSDCRSTTSVVSLTTLAVSSADACPSMMDVHPVGDSVAVAVGSCIMRSTNRGRGWSQTSREGTSRLNGVDFLSVTEGVAVGNDGTIEWTTDGGRTWRRERIAHTNGLYDVSADPAGGSVIAVGAEGMVLRTN